MTDRPIIFSAPMVRALLEGRKTQTRRILKPQPETLPNGFAGVRLPYTPGDRLYVREAWRAERGQDQQNATEIAAACLDAGYTRVWAPIFYEVDAHMVNFENGMVAGRYRVARFMPRWASRMTLTVTEVRVQRLQDISVLDCSAEGCDPVHIKPGGDYGNPSDGYLDYRLGFSRLWNSLHGAGAWDANPWVVALTFTVQHGNIDKIGGAA